jgi:hypothetical protein
MDNLKSYEFTFLYLINKCILLFKYIDKDNQKDILYNIKVFINKLETIFSKTDFKDSIEKKNKILEVLIKYFENIIDNKVINLITDFNKTNIIIEVEKQALLICENDEKKGNIKTDNLLYESLFNKEKFIEKENMYKKIDKSRNINENKSRSDYKEVIFNKNNIYNEKVGVIPSYIPPKSEQSSSEYSTDFIEFEKKINNKIKTVFYEIESNIKASFKEYFSHTEYVEYDLDQKFNAKLQQNNEIVENKIRDILKELTINKEQNINDKIYEYINTSLKYQINDLYGYFESIIKEHYNNSENSFLIDDRLKTFEKDIEYKVELSNTDIKKKINSEIENKISLLGTIFNESIEKIFNGLNQKIIDNEDDLLRMFEDKIKKSEFNKHNFNIQFDKDINEIKLYYCNDLIASTKLNIKGLIGPKGPEGNPGQKGETPIIRKIRFTDNNKIKLIIQDSNSNNIYEVVSDESVPSGPQGIQGERGEPGKSNINLKWDQENVMRVDEDNNDSLIFLKSLCVGEKSHCLKNNSISTGGGVCYNDNSLAIGQNSKTLDSESVAIFGSTVGKKAFSYRADNVDENCVQFGKKDKTTYNINSYDIKSKEINLECDIFKIKTNKYENNKIKEMEEKIVFLEKKMAEILKKI